MQWQAFRCIAPHQICHVLVSASVWLWTLQLHVLTFKLRNVMSVVKPQHIMMKCIACSQQLLGAARHSRPPKGLQNAPKVPTRYMFILWHRKDKQTQDMRN
jgi:hypothetical protein